MKQLSTAKSLLLLLVLLMGGAVLGAEELIPKSVWTEQEVFPSNDNRYGAAQMIDNDLKTCVCFLDQSRNGSNPKTIPAYAAMPITTEFVLDLGSTVEAVGLRFVSRDVWRTIGVRNVSVFATDDPQGRENIRPLKENEELLPSNGSSSVFVFWKKTPVRYLLVKVNDAWHHNSRRVDDNEKNYNVQIAEIRCLTKMPADPIQKNAPNVAFPIDRLHRDWMMQDYGIDITPCFQSAKDAKIEQAMIEKVFAELKKEGQEISAFQKEYDALVKAGAVGTDPNWKKLYLTACEKRRQLRLEYLREETRQIVYVKHFVFGGTEGLTGMTNVSDEQHLDLTSERRPGSQLCMITFNEDGSSKHEVLIEKPNGVIRDPALSWDAKTLLFSMRDTFDSDDYHLYQMNLADRRIKQLTWSPVIKGVRYNCADFEPCFAPSGDILFASTRHIQINDCWPNANTDIYTCKPDGSNIRRLTYDELDVNHPQILHDGKVIFTRWEYSDRNAFFMHPLCTMNPDGTAQTEYVGNNSMFPSSHLQARAIPDSTKVLAVIGGHHVLHKGKLALIDRTLGTQDGKYIEFVAGASPDGVPGRQKSQIVTKGVHESRIDFFGQRGPQFQNPYPFDEDHYLVGYCPEGWLADYGPFVPPFGVYFMTANGERELLAFDWWISSTQPIPIVERPVPPIRPSQIDFNKNMGTFDIQDVYFGPGLKGIPRGTVKKLRVVALEYRAGKIGKGTNRGEVSWGLIQTPVSFNSGTWDVKHVLGEVDIEKDGSVAFQVPARTPVYFQLLDEKGYCVQTMRSWATLQPGERFSCLGCHEDKLDTQGMVQGRSTPIAMQKVAQQLHPIGSKKHPLMERLEKESALASLENYFGINAPAITADPKAPSDGFSYLQEVQPILDKHCVSCHGGDSVKADGAKKIKPASPDLRGTPLSVTDRKLSPDDDHKRLYAQSYLTLTNNGTVKDNKYIQFLEVRSRSEMLPPYHTGSSKSPLMKYLEPSHYNVKVTDSEKRTIACWIDLLIPYCGSYPEANIWTDEEKEIWKGLIQKRRAFAQQELDAVRNSLKKK